jgi:hypothetical protein
MKNLILSVICKIIIMISIILASLGYKIAIVTVIVAVLCDALRMIVSHIHYGEKRY